MQNEIFLKTIVRDNYTNILDTFKIKTYYCGLNSNASVSSSSQMLNKDYYTFIYVLRGEFTIVINDVSYEITTNDIIYIPKQADCKFCDIYKFTNLIFINIGCFDHSLDDDFQQFLAERIDFVMKDFSKQLKKYFVEIYDQSQNQKPAYAYYVDNLVQIILINLIRNANKNFKDFELTASYNIFNEALKYIDYNISEPIKISAMAASLKISSIYLYKIFKKNTNKSPQEYIIEYKLNEATKYLANSNYTIKMISDILGFSNQNYFSNCFKKHYQLSPSAYRKQM